LHRTRNHTDAACARRAVRVSTNHGETSQSQWRRPTSKPNAGLPAGVSFGRLSRAGARASGWLPAILVALALAGDAGPAHRQEFPQTPEALKLRPRAYPASVDHFLRALKRGVDEYAAGHYGSALSSLPDTVPSASIAVADYALLYRGKATLMLKDGEGALMAFRALAKLSQDSPLTVPALLGEAQALLMTSSPAKALEVLENPRLDRNLEATYLRGKALELSGRTGDAVAAFMRLYVRNPVSKEAAQAEERLKVVSPGFASRPANLATLLERCGNLITAGKYRDAKATLTRLAAIKAPDQATGQKRFLLTGEVEYHLGRTAAALASLNKVGNAIPALHARSLYLKAACYRRLGREDSLLALRDQALSLYPRSNDTERLLYSVATHFDVDNIVDRAEGAYRQLLDSFPSGEYVERCRWKLAVYAYSGGRYEEALGRFWQYLRAYPNAGSAGSTTYWLARCCERLGAADAAAGLFDRARRLSNEAFYGERAAEALAGVMQSPALRAASTIAGIELAAVNGTLDGVRFEPVVFGDPSAEAARFIERANQLASAGLYDLALSDLRWAIRKLPSEKGLSLLAAEAAATQGDHLTAISLLRRAIPDYESRPRHSLPIEVWDLLFPVKHVASIADECSKRNLEPALVLAIIRQESGFKIDARSVANARGLMQVLPSTGRRLAREAGLTRYSLQKLETPGPNIALGTLEFEKMMARFGRVDLALAAYNAGPGRVDRWQQQFGTVDTAEFVERIPFSETRAYVRQVMTNRAHYRALIGRIGTEAN
jgi:soluble lytic murein transglycosylase